MLAAALSEKLIVLKKSDFFWTHLSTSGIYDLIILESVIGLAVLASTCTTQKVSYGTASFLVFAFVKKILL